MPRKAFDRISILSLSAAIAVFGFVTASHAQHDYEGSTQDSPDLRKEERLHQIYKSWNEQPTSDDSWQSALASGSTQTYLVQKGDTLWDISETFFGDPNFYPKVWALNSKQMLNPHEITPTEIIQFVEGTSGEPPQMTLAVKMDEDSSEITGATSGAQSENPSTDSSTTPGDQAATAAVSSEVTEPTGEVLPSELPPPLYESKKRASLPRSLPRWNPSAGNAIPPRLVIKKALANTVIPDRYLQYYLTEGPIEGEGIVTETEHNTSASPENHFVYVKLKNNLQNRVFTVVRTSGEIEDKEKKRDGIIVQVLGQIEVLEVVNAKENLYRALVRKSLDHVSKGGILLPIELPTISSSSGQPATAVQAKVIGGAMDDHRTMFGPDEIIYLNAGTADGVNLGQSVSIYRVQSLRNEETEVSEHPRQIGVAKIVKVSGQFATALVLHANEEIYVGDKTDPNTVQE